MVSSAVRTRGSKPVRRLRDPPKLDPSIPLPTMFRNPLSLSPLPTQPLTPKSASGLRRRPPAKAQGPKSWRPLPRLRSRDSPATSPRRRKSCSRRQRCSGQLAEEQEEGVSTRLRQKTARLRGWSTPLDEASGRRARARRSRARRTTRTTR